MDLTGDYRFFDFTETATHLPISGGSDSVPKSLRQPVRKQDSTGVWIVSDTEATWQLWDDEVTTDPRPGDIIVGADSVRWKIETAEYHQGTAKWECFATRQQSTTPE